MRSLAHLCLLCLMLLGSLAPAAANAQEAAAGIFLPLILTTPDRLLIAAAHIDSARSGDSPIGDCPAQLAAADVECQQ